MAFSIADVIAQNTAGKSEGLPVGVPESWGWYEGLYKPAGYSAPPSNFTSVTGWGQVYQKAGEPAYSNPNATVEVANAKTYIHLKTGEWVLVEDQAKVQMSGAHFTNNFSGDALAMKTTALSGGGTAFSAPPNGYNDHFWYNARGTYTAGMVDAVYVQMDMRVTDPNLHLIANVGADWWRDANAPFVSDFSNNPGAGISNWVELSTQWSTLGFYSSTTAQFQADLPPPLLGSPTTEPETKPTILSYSTDSGVAGDGITNDSTLTLSGTAKAGSSVNVFDGGTKIGTTTANAGGTWNFTTGQLSNATHAFTASTTDATGKAGTASSVLNVKVDTSAPVAPKITAFTPDTGTVGDGITSANIVTLTGTAEAGSSVKVFDGSKQIGVATTNTSGTWSYKTAQLASGQHVFTATASDVAGNTSTASAQTSVTINTATTPPVTDPVPTDPVTGENLLVNGSFEASTVRAGAWGAFSSVPGWTAIAGGTIELWNNLNGVKATDGVNFGELDYLGARDGFYQTVKTVAGQSYELSFDARTRFAGASNDIEVLWNNSVISTIPPGNNWDTYTFAVTGTGGQDRLTFRETSSQSVDGLGALYDNVSLVATQSTASAKSSATTVTNQALDLVTQYSAANYASSAPGIVPMNAGETSSLAPTLTQPGFHS
jgi:hypothetical protein